MKRSLLALFALILVSSAIAQNTYTDAAGRWRIGLNMGGIWSTSDVKTVPGLGGGFNIEKILNKKATAPIGFSIGFRYLGGRTYGMSTSPTYDIRDNKALNGSYDSTLRYDSVPGYFYANHKTFVQEGGLELKVNFPRFEQRTHLIFHFWGGIGIGKFKTWIDARDADGKLYDFTSLHAQTANQSDLTRIFNGSYETLAQGSGANGTIRPIPAVGVGFGVRLGRSVAIVLEHKVSFPLTDYFDGYAISSKPNNDYYHYTALNLIFTVHAKGSTSSSTHSNSNVYTNNTQTVTTNGNVTSTQTVAAVPPPAVTITYPSNNFNSQYDNVNVTAQVTHVTSAQQIAITLNGYPLQHFSYNNGTVNFQSFLGAGNNYFVVTATNAGGTASGNVNVIYQPPFSNGGNITNTVTVNTPTASINTNTTVAVNTPTASINTGTTTTTHNNTVTVNTPTASINTGTTTTTNTTVTVNTPTASINTGTVTANTTTTVPTGTLNIGQSTSKPPVIQIINPSVNPYEEPGTSYNVSASILNITNASQISITVNNVPITQYTYGQNNKMLNFFAPVQDGSNTVVIKATNNYGSDTKSTVITHKGGKPPKVVITTPASSPFVMLNPSTVVTGYVYNVLSASNVKVMQGSASIPFTFNPVNSNISINVTVPTGTTQVTITGTNNYGSDSQTATLVYKKLSSGGTTTPHNDSTTTTGTTTTTTSGGSAPAGPGGLPHPPTVSIVVPATDPYSTTNATENVTAAVTNITNASQVTVTKNGAAVAANYNGISQQVTFVATLVTGANTYVVTATNSYGTASKSVTINYSVATHNGGGILPGGGLNQQITICHHPPGNPNNTQQLTIPISAWPAHQAHGDTQGPCPNTNENGGGNNNGNNGNGGNNGGGNGNNGGGNGNGNHGGLSGGNLGGGSEQQITICHIPPGNTGNPQTITIPISAWPAHQAHGDTQGACQTSNNSNGNNGGNSGNNNGGNGNSNGNSGNNGNNNSGNNNGNSGNGGNNNGNGNNNNGGSEQQITICHIPPGNTGNPQTITIPVSAWPAHQAHGDTQGACPVNHNNGNGGNNNGNSGNNNGGSNYGNSGNSGNSGNNGNSNGGGNNSGNSGNNSGGNNNGGGSEQQITICHIPPGNTGNPQTITIPISAWPAHQAHGDTKGACQTSNNGNGNNGGNSGGNNGGGNSGGNNGGGNGNGGGNNGGGKGGSGGGGIIQPRGGNSGGDGTLNGGKPGNIIPNNNIQPDGSTPRVTPNTTTTPSNNGSGGRPIGGGGGR